MPTPPTKKVFISYRRVDSRSITLAIRLRLSQEPDLDVFQDITNIPDGYDFRTYLKEGVTECDVLVVVIGNQWLEVADDQGRRRLDNPDDFVRIEVKTGLERNGQCLVLPVLVNDAAPPPETRLPDDLKALATLNMRRKVREEDDFEPDMTRLIEAIRGFTVGERPPAFRGGGAARPPSFKQNQAIADFYEAQEEGDWVVAEALLDQIARYKANNPTKLLGFQVDDNRDLIAQARQNEHRDEEYAALRLSIRKNPRGAEKALEAFWQVFPDYDPDGLGASILAERRAREEAQRKAEAERRAREEAEKKRQPPKKTVASLLPAPFAWVPIAGGSETMQTRDTNITLQIPTTDYQMAKYPATNAQYAKFIDAKGYDHKAWWTAEGWEWRQKENWMEPRYWRDATWNGAEQPVVGVSWFEAVAFCQWLSDETGEHILLPTEAQWQYAAQGKDGRAYPWGNEWDAARCNHNVDNKGVGKTTPVRHYEGKGDSPFGVVDMAGNVWEWCLTDYDKHIDDMHSRATDRVLRGGSWYYNSIHYFRCDFRLRNSPHFRSFVRGFRFALS
jgi:formylglycine-generating enzyme required for sulfatase activity